MLLFIKSLPKMFGSAIKDMHRHVSMTFSSIFSIGIALLMAAFMFVIYMNIGQFTTKIEDQFLIQVSLSPTIDETQIESIESEIESLKGVKNVTFSSKEEELDALIKDNGEMFEQYKGDKNPLYDTLHVELKDNSKMDAITKKIKKLDGVVKATYGGSAVSMMIRLFDNLRVWGSVFVGVMILIAVFLIRNTIKMTIMVRKDEIWIMRTVGAYNWYITLPFVLEGVFIGFWGALGPALICLFGYSALYQFTNGMFFSSMLTMVKPFPFVVITALGLELIGILVGMFGSYLAVRKYLRWTR